MEETWPTEGPTAFLGAWCLRPSRSHIWREMEYEVLPYHWDERNRIPEDVNYLNSVVNGLLPALGLALNEIHEVNMSTRYWRIIAGWWLTTFAHVYFDRWRSLTAAATDGRPFEIRRIPRSRYDLASVSMLDFQSRIVSDDWNEAIWGFMAEEWFQFDIHDIEFRTGAI